MSTIQFIAAAISYGLMLWLVASAYMFAGMIIIRKGESLGNVGLKLLPHPF